MRTLLSSLLLTFLVGCASTNHYGSARTLDRGTWEGGAAVGVQAGLESQGHAMPLPEAQGLVRYGVTDQLELNARLSAPDLTATVGLKVGLVRSATAKDGFNLSLVPQLQYCHECLGRGSNTVGVQLPLLFGQRIQGGEITFGPLAGLTVPSRVGPVSSELGAMLGGLIPLGSRLKVMPEVSVLLEGPPHIHQDSNVHAETGAALLF